MTFEQIGYFLALVEKGSFVGAARRCGIAQPSLSNAIKSLEAALGAPLFERAATGAELTAFGKTMHPLLNRLYDDRQRALEFAHAFHGSANGRPVARLDVPHLQSRSRQAPRNGKSSRRVGIASLAILLACATVAIASPVWAGENDVEVAIREMLPKPFRCSRTTQPALYCRHDNPADRAMVLELASSPDGPSALLTHDYDDARRDELLAIMRRFFARLGVAADAFDECIERSQWQPGRQSANSRQMLCFHVELGDRVTREVFMMPADAAPMLADAGEVAR